VSERRARLPGSRAIPIALRCLLLSLLRLCFCIQDLLVPFNFFHLFKLSATVHAPLTSPKGIPLSSTLLSTRERRSRQRGGQSGRNNRRPGRDWGSHWRRRGHRRRGYDNRGSRQGGKSRVGLGKSCYACGLGIHPKTMRGLTALAF